MSNTALSVYLRDIEVGAVAWDDNRRLGYFRYVEEFVRRGIEIAPLQMPLTFDVQPYSFESHVRSSCFHGLPGMLADSLPDAYGTEVLRKWLTTRNMDVIDLNPVMRLSFIGRRGMGALEFRPSEHDSKFNISVEISLEEIAEFSEMIREQRKELDVRISSDPVETQDALDAIFRIESSAGGAQPKAVIAMNNEGRVLSGQVEVPDGFKHYLIKFNPSTKDKEKLEKGLLSNSGNIEFAYYKLAEEAKINMAPSRVIEAGGSTHFLTERFDRIGNSKVHVQTLAAMAHLDRDLPHDYAQFVRTARSLDLGKDVISEIYRRMVFNALALNHDDHTKNHGFMLCEAGTWKLTPAYDLTYSHNSHSQWTRRHQMTIGGKQSDFSEKHLIDAGLKFDLSKKQCEGILDEVKQAMIKWPEIAKDAGLDTKTSAIIHARQQKCLSGIEK